MSLPDDCPYLCMEDDDPWCNLGEEWCGPWFEEHWDCWVDLGPWGAWRACVNEITAFVATTRRDPLTTDTWHALALYWCGNDDNQCGIDELLDAVGWSP